MGRIVFNGKEYASLEEMPPDVHAAYTQLVGAFADRDGNGIPDILEGGATVTTNVVMQSSITVNHNG